MASGLRLDEAVALYLSNHPELDADTLGAISAATDAATLAVPIRVEQVVHMTLSGNGADEYQISVWLESVMVDV